jgi:PAS domain S-box-containing protein
MALATIVAQERTKPLGPDGERGVAEVTFEENLRRFRAIFENSLDAILLFDDAGCVKDGNSAACHLLGFSHEELVQLSFADVTPVPNRPRIPELMGSFLSQGTLSGEYSLRRKDETIREVEYRAVKNIMAGLHLSIIRDITERKRAEEKLSRSEAMLSEAQHLAHIGSWNWNVAGNSIDWSDEHYRICGLRPQEMAMNFERALSCVHPDDRPMMQKLVDEAFRNRRPYECCMRTLHADGTVRVIQARGQVIFDTDGAPVRMFGTVQDITDQRQAEEQLRQSEERLQLAVSATNLGIFEHDHRTDAVYWSPAMREMLGCGSDEPASLSAWFELMHPDDCEKTMAAIRRAHDPAGEGRYKIEHRIKRRDGSVRWLRICSRTYFEGAADTRRPLRTIGTMADITEPKQRDEELRQRVEQLRALGDNLHDGAIFQVHLSAPAGRRNSYVSAGIEKLLGVSSADLDANPWAVHELIHPDDRARIEAAESRADAQGLAIDFEYRARARDGALKWINARSAPRVQPDGTVVRDGILLDITARKQVEEARNRLAAIVESAEDAIISTTLNGVITSWNAGAERLLGYSAQDVIGKNIALIIPMERQEEEPRFRARIALGESIEHCETVRLHNSGRRLDVALSISPIRDSAGKAIGYAKIMHDISARKCLEKEVLEIATREQRRIGHAIHDTIGQELTALNLLADSLIAKLARRASPDAVIAGKLATGLQRVIGQIRGIARGLVPVEVDSQGLLAALAALATRISESSGVICTLDRGGHLPEVDDNHTATHLFHIAQEAVTNALRHGRPSHITLALSEVDGAVTLRIQDDGVGFPGEAAEGNGMGLKIMHYRAGLINGRLTVGPASPRGTAVTCKLFKGASHEPEHD